MSTSSHKTGSIKKIGYLLLLIAVFALVSQSAAPLKADAQAPGIVGCIGGSLISSQISDAATGAATDAIGGAIGGGGGGAVPVNEAALNKKAAKANNKEFTLDSLAFCAAKQVLHQMTISTVNWINSGFEGSPAYLTDPGAFFLDAADQVTGEFISQSGPLSSLCSPWRVDVRLALALGQYSGSGRSRDYRYRCTLDTIIGNAENASTNGFIGGDFRQGGWPAFLAMTTDPRNNPYGSYLQANSELQQKIGSREAAVNRDLDRGRGFMSWQNCKDVTVDSITVDGGVQEYVGADMEELEQLGGVVSTKIEKRCTTETPGSVIADTLQKQLGVNADGLNVADEMNEIISALVTQLTSQVLGGGLRSLSPGGYSYSRGGQPAYFTEIQNEIRTENTASAALLYDQAIGLVTASKSRYEAARICFYSTFGGQIQGQPSSFQPQIDAINVAIQTRVDPLIVSLTTAKNAPSATSVGATQALLNAQPITANFDQEAAGFQSTCNSAVQANNPNPTTP